MPKQVDAHRILMRGVVTVQAFGRFDAPLGKKRQVTCTLIEHFLFFHNKRPDKTADGVILLEYHTVRLLDVEKGAPISLREPAAANSAAHSESAEASGRTIAIELRRQNLLYSPSHTLVYRLTCMLLWSAV